MHTGDQQSNSFSCERCDATFAEVHHLRIQIQKKNANNNQKKDTVIKCEECGQIFTRREEFEHHKKNCDTGFQESNTKECIYFRRGHCLKRSYCRFKHGVQGTLAPKCRNGIHCRFLRSGVCSFFHPGIGVQKPEQEYLTENQEEEVWCKYSENCFKIPNSPFIHSNQDFPQLPKNNKPPLGARRVAKEWEDY